MLTCFKILLLVIGLTLSLQAQATRPPDRTLQQWQILLELTLTPQLLTCSHDPENRSDRITLTIPPMAANPIFKQGLTLSETLDLWFDPGCDANELARSMAKVGNKLKTSANVTVMEKWYGGFGIPCQQVLEKQIYISLMPMEYYFPGFQKTTVLKTYPSTVCD